MRCYSQVCVCVCVCVRVCVCVCVCACAVPVHPPRPACELTQSKRTCAHTYTSVRLPHERGGEVELSGRVHTHRRTHTHTTIHPHTHTYTHINTYTRIHTHTYTGVRYHMRGAERWTRVEEYFRVNTLCPTFEEWSDSLRQSVEHLGVGLNVWEALLMDCREVCVRWCVCRRVYMGVCVSMYVWGCMAMPHKSIPYLNEHTHRHTQTCTSTYTHIHTHTHAHTLTHSCSTTPSPLCPSLTSLLPTPMF